MHQIMTFAAYFKGLTSASNQLRKRTSNIQKIFFFLLSLPHYSIYLSFSTSAFKRAHKEAKLSLGEAEDHSTVFSGGPTMVEKTI